MRIVKGSSFATWTKRLQGKSTQPRRWGSPKSRLKDSPKEARAKVAALSADNENAKDNEKDNDRDLPREDPAEGRNDEPVDQSTDAAVDSVERKADEEVRDAGPTQSADMEKRKVERDSVEEEIVEEANEVEDQTDKVELLETEETHDKVGRNDSRLKQVTSPSEHSHSELDGSNELIDENIVKPPRCLLEGDGSEPTVFHGQEHAQEHDAVMDSRYSYDEIEGNVGQVNILDPEKVQREDPPDQVQGEDPREQFQAEDPLQQAQREDPPEQVQGTNEVYERAESDSSILLKKEDMSSSSEVVSSDNSQSAVDVEDSENQLENSFLQAQAAAARIMALFETADEIANHGSPENLNKEHNQESSGSYITDALGNEKAAVAVDGTKEKYAISSRLDGTKEEEAVVSKERNEAKKEDKTSKEMGKTNERYTMLEVQPNEASKNPSPANDDKEEVERELDEHITSMKGKTKSKVESLENSGQVPVSSSRGSEDSWDSNGIRHSVAPVRKFLKPKMRTVVKRPKRKSKSKGNQSNVQDHQKPIDLLVPENLLKSRKNDEKVGAKSSKDESLVGIGELVSSGMGPNSPVQLPSTSPEAILSKLLSDTARLSKSEEHDAQGLELSEMVMWSGDNRLGAESFEIVAVKSSSYAKARKEHEKRALDDSKKRDKSKKRKDKVRKGKIKDSTKSKRLEGSKRKHEQRSKRSLSATHSDLSDVMEQCACREVVDDGPALCNAIPDEMGEEEDAGCRDMTYDMKDAARELAMKGPRVILKWLE